MKAEDTVMSYEEFIKCSRGGEDVLAKQAEISFKAGYAQSVSDNDNWARETYGYKLGREELKKQVEGVKVNAFSVSLFGDREHQLKMDAMVSAYMVVLNLIEHLASSTDEES